MVLPATRCLLALVRASAHLRIVTTTYNTGASPLKRLNIRSRLYSTPPYYLFPGMAQYPISLKDLAAGLVNPVGDPEDLIIQYPQDCSQEFTKAQLTPILIPRVPVVGMYISLTGVFLSDTFVGSANIMKMLQAHLGDIFCRHQIRRKLKLH